MGQAQAQQGNYEDAISSLQRAIDLKADVPEAHAALGVIYLKQGKLPEAAAALRTEIRISPGDFATRSNLATVLQLQGEHDEPVALLRDVLKVRPEFADAQYLLGKILLADGATDEAVRHLEEAARVAPQDFNIHYQLGRRTRNWVEAIWRSGVRPVPRAQGQAGREDAMTIVAGVLCAVLVLPTSWMAADPRPIQERSKAVAPAQSAPTPRNAPAARGQAPSRERLLTLASTELSAGRRAEAERLLLQAADRFDSVEALLRLARLQAGRGDQQAAIGSLRRARALAPNSEEVLSGFAQVSLAARAITPAILALQALTRICPTVAQYHYLLGVGLMQAGDFAAAVESLEQANRLEPNRGLTLIALGLGYNSRKMYAEARSYLQRGIELEPESIDAIAALAESEEGLGELDAAEAHARQVLAKAGNHPTPTWFSDWC